MAGGLMQLVSIGQQNLILNGNPSKTFWKAAYKKYTNYGKQNFRLDFEGTPSLSLTTESTFNFKIRRYADLLMDCYISINLPTIWSPIFPPQAVTQPDGSVVYTDWAPYNFQWIKDIGAQIISRITITCGNQKLQEYSGQYILASTQRDFSGKKLEMFNEMIGNVPELNDPANAGSRVNAYPNAFFAGMPPPNETSPNPAGAQPSIDGRNLIIPLGAWFNLVSTQALSLIHI